MSDRHWLYEAGIGENRAALIEAGELVEAHVENTDAAPLAGAIVEARLIEQWQGGRCGIVAFDGGKALLQSIPDGLSEGASLRVELVREAVRETGGKAKRALARAVADDEPPADGAKLLARTEASGLPVDHCHVAGPDRLAEAGWHEVIEEAATGHVAFSGGELLIAMTPAMAVIDVDGTLAPRDLALTAAPVIAHAIRRLGLAGNIGIDFPTLAQKADRNAVADAFDAAMSVDCERTAINGFGFMQVVTKKVRPSLVEVVQADPVRTESYALLRSLERDSGTGLLEISAPGHIKAWLERHPDMLEMLERRTGRPVRLAMRHANS